MRWNRHTVMLCQHLFIACQLRWTKKKKNSRGFKKSTCKDFHCQMAHLTCQTRTGDSTIYICDYLLGYPIHFPRSYINHCICTCLTLHSKFRIEKTLFSLTLCILWFSQPLLVLIDAIYLNITSAILMTAMCCKGLWDYSVIWYLE